MRRSDREATDYTENVDILRCADAIRLSLQDMPYPYVVPMSFGFGKADCVTGDDAIKGPDLLLVHCGYDGFLYDHTALNVTAAYKITPDSFTGKHRFVKGES